MRYSHIRNSMEQSQSRNPLHFIKLKTFCYRVYMSLPPFPLLIHKNPVSTLRSSQILLFMIQLNIILRTMPRSLPFIFPSKALYAFLSPSYKFWCSSICIFLHPFTTFSLLVQNIFLSNIFSNTLILCFSLNVETKIIISIYNKGKNYSNIHSYTAISYRVCSV